VTSVERPVERSALEPAVAITPPAAAQRQEDKEDAARAAPESIERTVQQLNEIMQDIRRELHFSVDETSGRTVIKVIDVETQEVVRQIPQEEALSLARTLASSGLIPEILA
jgi:flagellar protein FlaG